MDEYIPCLDPPLLPTEECNRSSPSSVILDDTAYISAAAVSNATTAAGRMSTGAPIPDSATGVLFHETTKVIALECTTVGWVDLWRGILFCDVLDEKPVLCDMPLPKPERCNRGSFCKGGPYGHRDITVVTLPEQSQMSIKYVEMRTRPGDVPSSRGQQVDRSSSGSDDDDVDDYWTATVWTMPVPIASWKDWHAQGLHN
ncbi:hypothetical protein SEVIR_9G125454v4 [Setaria viridis]